MIIVRLRLDGTAVRRWHVGLCERLVALPDLAITIDSAPAFNGLPPTAERLFQLERLIHRLPSGLGTMVGLDALDPFVTAGAGAPSRVLDLCGDVDDRSAPVWRLDFDGLPGESGLFAAVQASRSPVTTIREAGTVIATARLGTEAPGIAVAAFDDYLARVITLILAAFDGAASTTLPTLDGPSKDPGAPAPLAARDLARVAAKTLARKAVRLLYTTAYHAPHWRIGWRRVAAGPDLIDLRRHPDGGWTDLPDDRRRFLADPFPFEHEGRITLFVEEFEHARQKGIISAIPFGPNGPEGPPEPVLELPYHLSYPFVFREDDAVWMIPESCAAGTIDLYRATDFPRGWVHDATLVKDVVASDATIVRHEGRWWMFATVRDGGGAFSDTLHLWSAPHFRGPWTPHARNPVLIDIASARPAGRIVTRDGDLIRPVQDCRRGYGHALGLARIIRLDDTGFAQTVETTLHAGPSWPGRRLHTLNEAGGYEFIDGSGHARKRLFDTIGR